MFSAQSNRVIYEYKFRPDSTNDPVQGMREIMNQPNSKIKININGKEISDPKEVLRAMEQNAREEMKKNNNKIELIP
jgi:hypothetical protein